MNIDHDFDQKARALHAASLEQVPFSVTTRLHPRQPADAHAKLWRPVMAGAMVFALAGVGLFQLQSSLEKPGVPAEVAQAAVPAPAVSPTTAMDNDPEFYAWLGSDTTSLHLEK